MSCTICHKNFSFFTREAACPGCGFSCCSRCLKYKSDTPEKRTVKICGRCYNKQSKPAPEKKSVIDSSISMEDGQDLDEPMAPIDIKKKLDSLENPAKPPITVYTRTSHWDKFKSGLEPADQEIVDRLRKLKEGGRNVPLPSEDEIRRRLAILKDEDPDASNCKINVHQVDTRTDEQKTDDLIQEYLEQLELAASTDPVSEIETRLRLLQGRNQEASGQDSQQSSATDACDDERDVTTRLISRALAEAKLESKYERNQEEEMDAEVASRSSDDEKPSCVMCDQTENLGRCLGCNGDLYCASCFEDNHEDFESQKHKRESIV